MVRGGEIAQISRVSGEREASLGRQAVGIAWLARKSRGAAKESFGDLEMVLEFSGCKAHRAKSSQLPRIRKQGAKERLRGEAIEAESGS
jgi:hypothetical protein